eukprot:1150534-Pelagomonas_calceolata.AAC.3
MNIYLQSPCRTQNLFTRGDAKFAWYSNILLGDAQPVVLERVPDNNAGMDGAATWMHTKVGQQCCLTAPWAMPKAERSCGLSEFQSTLYASLHFALPIL